MRKQVTVSYKKQHEFAQDEVDWKGLVAATSMLGNTLQALDRIQLKKKLHSTEERLSSAEKQWLKAFREKEQLGAALQQVRNAHENLIRAHRQLRSDFVELEKVLKEKDLQLQKIKVGK